MERYLLHQSHRGFASDLTGLEDHIRMENHPLKSNPHYHRNQCCHMTETSNDNLDNCKTAISHKANPLGFEPMSYLLQTLQHTAR